MSADKNLIRIINKIKEITYLYDMLTSDTLEYSLSYLGLKASYVDCILI